MHANDRRENAFPRLLLESFSYSGGIDGVKLVLSCRSERRSLVLGSTPSSNVEELELKAFSEPEASAYVKARIPDATTTELQVAHARSGGNPRVLEHLVCERGLLEPSEIDKKVVLDDLIRERIASSLRKGKEGGHTERELGAFLAGLAVRPPPVPLSEYADAHRLEPSLVESFAADLSPLLERIGHGLTLRDEPTETHIRQRHAASTEALTVLAEGLSAKQDSSVYAATALPGLLRKMGNGERLFQLAFDRRFPASITSVVGRQRIRYARLTAAVGHAASEKEYDRLVHLLVELSTLASINERGMSYLPL